MLYLLPAYLSDQTPLTAFGADIHDVIMGVNFYFAENEKTARRVIKFFAPEKVQAELTFFILNKYTKETELKEAERLMKQGNDFAMISEAGLPCIADPGNIIVAWAHRNGIKVRPVNGPSSIILALISSGFNGQQFSFHAYLPIDRKERQIKIQKIENDLRKTGYTQIFFETPYRNNQLVNDLCGILNPETLLCIAANINHPTDEFILTQSVAKWRKFQKDLNKIPAIFILGQNQTLL